MFKGPLENGEIAAAALPGPAADFSTSTFNGIAFDRQGIWGPGDLRAPALEAASRDDNDPAAPFTAGASDMVIWRYNP